MEQETQLLQIVKNDFTILAYREKYNLSFNDKRVTEATELEMFADVLITSKFKRYIKEKSEQEESLFDDEDEQMFEIQDKSKLEDWQTGKIKKLHIGGFTKEEQENFWNDDSYIDKELKVIENESNRIVL